MIIDNGYSLMVMIMDNGKATHMLQDFKKHGVSGGTILLGEGTANDSLLHMLEIDSIEKELILMLMPTTVENNIYERLFNVYEINRPKTGIAFSVPVSELRGIRDLDKKKDRREVEMLYEAIFVISENHEGDDVVEVAEKYGAQGATIIHGRGTGTTDKESIFNIVIEPEKEVVLIVVPKENSAEVIEGIDNDLNISKPGHGVIFSLGVSRTAGLVKDK